MEDDSATHKTAVTLTDGTTISECSADRGGALHVFSGTVTLRNGTLLSGLLQSKVADPWQPERDVLHATHAYGKYMSFSWANTSLGR